MAGPPRPSVASRADNKRAPLARGPSSALWRGPLGARGAELCLRRLRADLRLRLVAVVGRRRRARTELRCQLFFLLVAHDGDLDLVADLLLQHGALDVLAAVDVLAVDLDDQVAVDRQLLAVDRRRVGTGRDAEIGRASCRER